MAPRRGRTTTALYCRISQDREGGGLGVKRQEEDCRKLAADRGWEVGEVLVDNDVSAYSGKRRPGYERLVELVQAGDVGAVIAWHPDRLTRHVRELEDLIDLVESTGVKVATVTAGEYDLATATGRGMARMAGTFARMESEQKGERTKRKHEELARAGKPVGGTRFFGYTADGLALEPAEAKLVREAAKRLIAGDSMYAVALDFAQRGVVSTRGNAMKSSTLKRILENPRIAGKRTLGGEVVADAVWPAIVDDVTFKRLQSAIRARARGRDQVGWQARSYLLGGFLACGRCGERLVAHPMRGRRTYVCPKMPLRDGCGGIRIMAEPLEELIVGRVLDALPALALHRPRAVDDDSAVIDQIDLLERNLEQLERDHYTGLVARRGYLASKQAVEAELDAARRRLRVQDRPRVLEAVVEFDHLKWEQLSLDRKRALLGELVQAITISPARAGANRFDAERVAISWSA